MKFAGITLFCILFFGCGNAEEEKQPVVESKTIVPLKDTVSRTKDTIAGPERPSPYKTAADSLNAGLEKFRYGYKTVLHGSTGMEFARQYYDEAFALLDPLRENKLFTPEAQNALGMLLEMRQKEEEAFAWYQRSADRWHPMGLYNLATCYQYGTGTTKDLKKAGRFYLLSAKKNHGPAMCVVGFEYGRADGEMFEQSYAESAKWLERSVQHKEEIPFDTQETVYKTLKEYYEQGKGVQPSGSKADHYSDLYVERRELNKDFYFDRLVDH